MKYQLLMLLSVFFSTLVNANVKWQFDSQGLISAKPLVHQEHIYLMSGKSLKVLNQKGQLTWQYALKSHTFSEVAIENNHIYLLADNGLHAINKQGELLWFFETQDRNRMLNGETWGWGKKEVKDIWAWYRSSPIIVGDKVIFGNANGTFAIDKQTGQKIWHVDTGVTHTKPAFENNVVVVGSWNNNLYALDINTGEIKWQFEARVPNKLWEGWNGFNLDPLIFEGSVYVGSRGAYFYALDLQNGSEKWSSKFSNTWIGSAAVEHQGKIYFGTSDGFSLIGVDAKKGAQTLLYINDFYNFAQPQASDNTIYFGSVSGQIFAVNTHTMQGEKIFSTPESIINYADLVNEEGGLKSKFSLGDNYSYETSAKDVQRMLNKLNSILSITLHKNTLYITTAKGTLYALAI
ncbi:PQQ-binding-like beta-propeller repeat protein [Colwelliaceae bacterium 6441]